MSDQTNNISDPSEEPEKKEPEKKIKFSYFEPIAGIILAIAATVIFYFFPQIIAIVFVNGPVIPTFNIEAIKGTGSLLWIPIFLWAIFRLCVEVFYLVERRYTKRLAIVTMIGNTLAFICTLIVFIPMNIMNPEHLDWVRTHYINNAAWFGEILARANFVVIAIMLIGLILDSITVIRKGLKKKKKDDDDEDGEIKSEEVNINAEADKAAAEDVKAGAEEAKTAAEEV